MKKFLIVLLVIIAVVFIAMMALPSSYSIEESIEINAPQYKVFTIALNVGTWNKIGMLQMFGGMANMPQMPAGSIPKEANVPGVGDPSKLVSGVQDAGKAIGAIKIKVKSSTPPSKIVTKIEGGPVDGLEQDIALDKVDDKKTKVVIKESRTFEGFFTSGFKALILKFASRKLNRSNLDSLKQLCEK